MGCDIHAYMEFRDTPGGSWVFFAEFQLTRSYGTFSGLVKDHPRVGTVRARYEMDGDTWNDEWAIPARGFPSDADDFTSSAHDEDGEDAHTESWLTSQEWGAALDSLYGADRVGVEDYQAVVLAGSAFEHGCRIVFWFDN